MNTVKIDNYTFDKAAGTVTLTDFTSIRLDQIVSITDVTNNVQIFYNKLPNYGGSVATNVLTLDYDTTGTNFDSTDKLCIEVALDNYSEVILPDISRAVGGFSNPVTNYGNRGATFFLHVSAALGASPELTVTIQMQDYVSGEWLDIQGAVFPMVTGSSNTALVVYPGVTEAANAKVSILLPRVYRAKYVYTGTTTSFAFGLGVHYSK